MIMNMPSEDRNESLLWNVSSDLSKESTDLNIPSLSGTFDDILYYNNKIYALTHTSSLLTLSIYESGAWRVAYTFSAKCNNGHLLEYKGKIYIGVGLTSEFYFWVLNDDETSVTTLQRSGTSKSFRTALCKDVKNDILYFGYLNINDSGQYIKFVTYDGTTKSSSTQIFGIGSTTGMLYDFYVKDNKLYVSYYVTNDANYRLGIWDLINNISLGIDYTHTHILSTEIKNDVYSQTTLGLCYKSIGIMRIEKMDNVKGICDYNDSFLVYDMSDKFTKVKLYKTATSYAKKGTKILSNNSFAISDNLETIEGGYKVTETGTVEIGIYE